MASLDTCFSLCGAFHASILVAANGSRAIQTIPYSGHLDLQTLGIDQGGGEQTTVGLFITNLHIILIKKCIFIFIFLQTLIFGAPSGTWCPKHSAHSAYRERRAWV